MLKHWTDLTARMLRAPDDGGGSAGPAPFGGGGGDTGGSSVTPGGAGSADGGSVSGEVSGPSFTPAESARSTSPDWAKLGSTDDLDYIELPAEGTMPKPPEVPQEQPPAAPVQEPPPAEAAGAATPAEGESPPALSASNPMEIAAGLEFHRDEVLTHLAQTKFALTDQDIQELETDMVSAVPKIMSRVFFESQVSMQKFLAQAVPGMVKQFQTVTRANQDAEQMFFSAHKALDINNPAHRATAIRIATVYRQANPDISVPQLIAEVGPMVAAALRLNGHANGGQHRAAAPTPRGGTPFRPAVGGAGGAPTAEPVNEWSGLGNNFD